MASPKQPGALRHLREDVPASLVVFLVAVPLCLGIAVASGAPPLAGLVTGIVAGVMVAWLSGAQLAVSGPAAGLTVIVLGGITELGYEGFLLAVCLAGVLQLGLGALRAGVLAYYFPSAVIKGMLAGIGAILILKQLPHALGFDVDYVGDLAFRQAGDTNTFETLAAAVAHVEWAALLVSGTSLLVLVLVGRSEWRKEKLPWLPAPLVAVAVGVAVNQAVLALAPELALSGDALVALPTGGVEALLGSLSFPEWSRISELLVWRHAFVLAAVASLETLLSIEAIDKLDPLKRVTPTNRELLAQGTGNVVAGMLGGLPMTAVIIRGSVNVKSGAHTRLSAFLHGLWLLLALLLVPQVMNLVPLAALAAVLLHVGYQLISPALVRSMFRQPAAQWLPFAVTVAGVVLTDLLVGVVIGLAVAIFLMLRTHAETPFFLEHRDERAEDGRTRIRLQLAPVVSFLHRASVRKVLDELPSGSRVEIDARRTRHVHPDVIELVRELEETAPERDIEVSVEGELHVATPAEKRRARRDGVEATTREAESPS